MELPGTADQQRSQLLGALQSGSSHYDVVNLDVTWVPEFADGHLVRELDDSLLDDDVLPSVAATGRWCGSTYAVPFSSDVGLLYYRLDYLRAAGVNAPGLGPEPTTWVAFRNLKQVVLRAHGRGELPTAYAMPWTTQLSSYEGLTVNGIEAFAMVGASGGDAPLDDDEGRYVGTEEQLRLGLGEFTRRIDRAYTLDSAQESDEARLLADFAAGRTAFLRHWPYAYGVLHQDLRGGRLGLAALLGKAVLGGQNLAVTRHAPARNLDAIEDLLRFLTGRTSERCLLEAGFAATRASAYEEDGARCPRGPARSARPSPTGEDVDPMPRTEDGRPRSYAVVCKAGPAQRGAPAPHPAVRRVHPGVRRPPEPADRRRSGRAGEGGVRPAPCAATRAARRSLSRRPVSRRPRPGRRTAGWNARPVVMARSGRAARRP